MEPNIMNTMRHLLIGDVEDTSFDIDIFTHTMYAITELEQLGVEPGKDFVFDNDTTWGELTNSLPAKYANFIQSYVYIKVKLIFDPPANSFLVSSMEKLLDEATFRISVATESEEE